MVHGMTPLGNLDDRVDRFSSIMAHCGFRVVSPLFNKIADLVIDCTIIPQIKQAIVAITRDSSLCTSGRLGIISASFPAGLSLIAAADPEISSNVSAFFCNGTYCDVDVTLRYQFGFPEIDDYSYMVILKNFFHFANGPNEKLAGAFEIAALDNFFQRKQPGLPAYLKTLSLDERKVFLRLRNDIDFRQQKLELMLRNSGTLVQKLALRKHLRNLEAAVALVHGTGDDIIPFTETGKIHEELIRQNRVSRLLVSPHITHQAKLRPGMLRDILKLVGVMNFFLKNVEGKSGL